MRLYILEAITSWEPWFDTMSGCIVQAKSPTSARKIAAEDHGDEGPEVWLDPKQTTCKELRVGTKEGLILRDFNAA